MEEGHGGTSSGSSSKEGSGSEMDSKNLIPDMENVRDMTRESTSEEEEEGNMESSSLDENLFWTPEEWNEYRERTGAQFIAHLDPNTYYPRDVRKSK